MEKGQKQVPLPETKPKPKGRQVIIKTEKQIEGIRKSSQLTKICWIWLRNESVRE